MKKLMTYSILVANAVALSSCATLANIQLQKRQLASGEFVYFDYNVTPTPMWNCKQVGAQSYDWAMLKVKGQFTLAGPYGLLMNNAINYANQTNLKTNYINLIIPGGKTLTTGVIGSRVSTVTDLNPQAQAMTVFYQCERINPEHKLGYTTSVGYGLMTGPSGAESKGLPLR